MVIFRYLFYYITIFFLIPAGILAGWQDISPKDIKEDLYGVSFVSRDSGYAVGWGSNGSIILSTTDGGQSWSSQLQPSTELFRIYASKPKNIYAVGFDFDQICGLLCNSTDGGKSWKKTYFTEEDKRFTFGLYDYAMTSQGELFVCGYNGKIFKSTDDGQSWLTTSTKTTDQIFSSMNFPSDQVGYAVSGRSFLNMNRVYKSADAGSTWSLISDFRDSLSIGSISFTDEQTGFLFGSCDGAEAILKTTDGGMSWSQAFAGTKSQEFGNGRISGKYGFALGQDGFIARTEDSGANWDNEFTGKTALYNDVSVCPEEGGEGITAYAVGTKGAIVRYATPVSVGGDILPGLAAAVNISGNSLVISHIPEGLKELVIYNWAGSEVLARSFLEAGDLDIPLEGLIPGAYYYSIYTCGRIFTRGMLLKPSGG